MSFQVSAMFPHCHKALFCIPAPSACAHCTLYTWWAEHVMASQLWALFLSQSIALDCFHCFKLRCICALFPRIGEPSPHQRDVGSTIPCSFQHLNHRCHSNTNTNTIQKCKHFLCLSCVTLRQLWFRSELFSLWKSHFFFIKTWWETCEIVGFSPLCDVVAPTMGWFCPVSNQCLTDSHSQDSSLHCCCCCCPLSSLSLSSRCYPYSLPVH